MIKIQIQCAMAVLFLAAIGSTVRADLLIRVDDIDIKEGTTSVTIPVMISGPDSLRSLSLAFGLGDGGVDFGGSETAQIISFSLDQTLWDTNAQVGVFASNTLSLPLGVTPGLPKTAAVFDFTPFSQTSSTTNRGAAIFLTIDTTGKKAGTTILLDPNFVDFTAATGGTPEGPLPLSFRAGTLTVSAVPEPSTLALIGCVTMAGIVSRRWRKRVIPLTTI